MPFQWFVALRYLRDSKGETALILSAVSVGVSVVVFLSALINGLQSSLIESTLGSQPHVTLSVPREVPRPLVEPSDGRTVARLIQPAAQRLRSIDQWPAVLADAERVAGVTAASATVTGSGVARRADARRPIVIRGVEADRFLATAPSLPGNPARLNRLDPPWLTTARTVAGCSLIFMNKR